MRLEKKILSSIDNNLVVTPTMPMLELKEKVIQFGTGVLLRGLPDYYIDRANKAGLFNGRIVMVKSTSNGDINTYTEQDGLYTHCLRGFQNGKPIEQYMVNAAISRVLTAATQWQQVLHCASDPAIETVVSNTTEAGLVLHPGDNIAAMPPVSFPGKLLAYLYRRYQFFEGDAAKGMVILPTELLSGNGDLLKEIVLQLAAHNQLEAPFVHWLMNHNFFCNTLVDRIVPGSLPAPQQQQVEALLGYQDKLLIMSETYGLWAIETTADRVKQVLTFADAASGCIVTDDIQLHKELKLRLLNAVHTFTCAWALQSGFDTVRSAMEDNAFSRLMERLMQEEIIPCIQSNEISLDTAAGFAARVLDRFRNPSIEHYWKSITLNYTQKIQVRCIPLITAYHKRFGKVPATMAKLFAAYLWYMNTTSHEAELYQADANGTTLLLQDEAAGYFQHQWQTVPTAQSFARHILGKVELWGDDLNELAGFTECVAAALERMMEKKQSGLYNAQPTVVEETK